MSGALRDTMMSTCFPSGIFINAYIEQPSLSIFSFALSGLFGKVN